MATQTPLRHPDENKQLGQFYPHRAEFKTTGPTGAQITAFQSPCAYEPYQGRSGESEEFEVEPPTGDQILLPTWRSDIVPDQLVVVTFHDATVRRFNVLDALPVGVGPNQTLVLATPKP